MGGVQTSSLNNIGPIIWKEEWPQRVNKLFKAGTLTNNNLDLAGLIPNYLALECLTYHVSEATQGKRHHHNENGLVVQSNVYHVYS